MPTVNPRNSKTAKKSRKFRAIVLFSGAGGSSYGARAAGIEIVAAIDLWKLAGDTHKANFPETEVIHSRLEDVDLDVLVKRIGKVDLIIASPECTSHSPAKGNKPRCEVSRDTAFQVVRFAEAFKCRWLVVENVVGMRRWSRYAEFKKALTDLGYKLREQVLNAAMFGVPQSRRRLFLMADRNSNPRKVKTRKRVAKTAAQIVNLNGKYKWTPVRKKKRAKATLERFERGLAGAGKSKSFLLVYYSSDHAGGWQRLTRPLRTITTVDRFAIVKPDRECGHVMRMLQVPELQAAMGMPAKMKFDSGTRRDKIKMIGNAVCPPVMKSVVRRLTQ